MPKNTNTVKYIPAGMQKKTESLDFDSGGMSTQKKSERNIKSPTANAVNSNAQKMTPSPPKTICKNKSLTVKTHTININQNSAFHSDIEGILKKIGIKDDLKTNSNSSDQSVFIDKQRGSTTPENLFNNSNNINPTQGAISKKLAKLKKNSSSSSSSSSLNDGTPPLEIMGAIAKNLAKVKDESENYLNSENLPQEFIGSIQRKSAEVKAVQESQNHCLNTDIKSKNFMHQLRQRIKTAKIKQTNSKNDINVKEDEPRNSDKDLPSKILDKMPAQETEIILDEPRNLHKDLPSKILHNMEWNKIGSGKSPPVLKTNFNEKYQQIIENNFNKLVEMKIDQNNFAEDNLKKTGNGLPLLKIDSLEKPPTLETKIDNKIILQGVFIPKQKFSLDETCIDDKIQTMLSSMNCTSSKHLQSYMWTAVQRGLSVFMIGPPGSGKTMSYLPIICTFCVEKKDRYRELTPTDGPLIIILCSDNESCYELQNITKTLISSCSDIVVDVLTDDSVQNCDILISTPSALEHSVKRKRIKLQRLCHLAIENAHVVLKTHNISLGNLFGIVNAMQIKRPHHKSIQVIISSVKWSVDLETLLKKLYVLPLMCFEDFLEAAIYSKVNFKKKKIKSLHKILYLIDILKPNYMTTKTVVFCDENEMSKIKEKLEISGIECISISKSLSEDEMFVNEETWNSLGSGQHKVLLCTDSTYEKTVHIVDAKWLVHYCPPQDWVHFQKRFRCFSKNIQSPLNPDVDSSASMWNFMVIDEMCTNELCVDFFEVLVRHSTKYLQL